MSQLGRVASSLSARRLALRARITLAFALGALLLSALLAGTTFLFTRANLVRQHESTATRQVYGNARIVLESLPSDKEVIIEVLGSLQTPTGSNPVVYYEGSWFPLAAEFGREALPSSLRQTVVRDGRPARMRYQLRGKPSLAVGVPLPSVGATYFEIVDLTSAETTLRSLLLSVAGAAGLTTAAGAALGWWASRRTLRPLSDVSQAARAIAGGRLETRLDTTVDPDLASLTESFNDMAEALQARIERDARFASDVSHELRSPLMTLSAVTEVLDSRRDELSDRTKAALDLLLLEVVRFQQLVEDLLEISRFDAGAVRLELDEVRLAHFVLEAVGTSPTPDVPVEVDSGLAGLVVRADKRRLGRVLANLLDNANRYGSGATAVTLRRVDNRVEIAVEDEGPGVAEEERTRIFDRFARGDIAGRRGTGTGVGLGLALVAEHVRLHGGDVWVEDRASGTPGARFVVRLPLDEPTATGGVR